MEVKDSIILKMNHISKEFPGVKALDNVSLGIKKGEVHALMGENGAGKSTLIKVLTGVHKPDKGTIVYHNQKVSPKSPFEAQNIGISTVYQEVNLCPNLSVAENIYIGREPMKKGKIDWNTMYLNADKLLGELNLNIDSREVLSRYSVAIQQMVAITRAVDISQGLLILDEPTSSLDNKEVEELFKVITKLKKDGMSIIFITHFINQVYAISDRITVLRNGKYIGTYETANLSYMELVSKMIGKKVENISRTSSIYTLSDSKENENYIQLENYGKKGKIESVDLQIHKGEVLGLAGLLGSGRTEIARLLFGIDKNDSGVLYIDNKMFKSMYPQRAILKGMAFCPEDRKTEAIIGELSIRENIILALQASKGYFKYISRKKQEEIAKRYIQLLSIKTPSMEQRIDNLSGGNQQKVILARWLATNPKLLILDEPTRGIDIGSRTEIQRLILQLASKGMTILLISSELDEIVKCCNRVLVLRDRKIIGELKNDDIKEESIMQVIASAGTCLT
ncbi:sugar ABC transporter ATP-binding protein [Vallitalea guaymasensis]|uniref:sugar ABC transporter ATP-binding protein n=1 Tax=Vallitalea guaymasensis TaxID=1185412 RepID=UPI000DE39C07|nr:sugar ABC transporter ATP-binding protein [Vallitalea guaymasensis]